MSLRGRFIAYLAVMHLLFAAVAVPLLRQNRLWLLAVETVFLLSFAAGAGLVRRLFGALDLVRESAAYLSEDDYSTRVRETGQKDLDALIAVYNRMVDHLRDERLRLQEQHHLLSKVLAVSPSGFLTLDFEGRLDFMNPSAEALLGHRSAEARGRTLAQLASPLASALDGLVPGQAQVVALWGGRRVKCHRGSFLDRGFPRSFVLMEELTEELRLYEKAAYEKLIRMMSHEVNNSVGASNSLLHSCLNYGHHLSTEDRADFENALRVVIARTEKLSAFMRSFAEVVRLPAPSRQACDLRGLVGDVARLMTPLAEQQGVALGREVSPEPLAADLDRVQMEQVLVNVVKNAIEAAGRGGRVTLRLARPNGRPQIVVEDTGPGIAPEARANLFTPFFTTKPEGQGIGLTVVQEILRQHRFDFSLDSAPGGPTSFTIVF
ncbi:MAG: sensor histidine kinase [Vicinamibacteria bacterium]